MHSDAGHKYGSSTLGGIPKQAKAFHSGMPQSRGNMTENLRNALWQILRDALFSFFAVLLCGHEMKPQELD